MKLITRDTDYALRALCFIAKKGKAKASVTELAAQSGIPRPFLRKILQTLKRNKILESCKGSGGGFCLGMPAHKIYLFDLIRIFQGQFRLNECRLKKIICPNIKKCLLKKKIDSIEAFAIKKLGSVTVASLLKG